MCINQETYNFLKKQIKWNIFEAFVKVQYIEIKQIKGSMSNVATFNQLQKKLAQ